MTPSSDTDPLFGSSNSTSVEFPVSNRRILVVDDEPGPRMALRVALSERYEVHEASGGHEAVTRVNQSTYDLVLLDIRMPDMNGFQALEQIRRCDPLLTVVMFTGVDGADEVRESMRIGARYFIPKVQPLAQLLSAIDGFIDETAVKRGEARLAAETRRIAEELHRERTATRPKIWQSDATTCFMHDLSSPLLTIDICLRVLRSEIETATVADPTLARLRHTVDQLNSATLYCRQLATHWRTLHRHTNAFATVDLREVAAQARDIALLPPTELTLGGSSQATVHGSPLDLTRLFQNLITNACQAQACHITITFDSTATPGRVIVQISDDGEGMSADLLQRLREAAVSTKAEGLGLGMEIVRQITQVHGATLTIDSLRGSGSSIRLDFPAG